MTRRRSLLFLLSVTCVYRWRNDGRTKYNLSDAGRDTLKLSSFVQDLLRETDRQGFSLSLVEIAFRVCVPKTWDSIPQSQTYSSFRRDLKTQYFHSALPVP